MIVVSDTSALTSLLKIGRIDLLRQLFGQVRIPSAVREELATTHPALPAFLQVEAVEDRRAVESLLPQIGRGEAEAIVLAEQISADLLLIDDQEGRRIAEDREIVCIGLAGALVLAKDEGKLSSVRAVLEELETRANFFMSGELKRAVLSRARELE